MPSRTRIRARFSRFIHCEKIEPRLLLTSYYVSPTGSDSAVGTSIANAWKTISQANTVHLLPGDQLLFQGGATFSGSLGFNSSDSGATNNPVTIDSYGTGRAVINGGDSFGLAATDVSNFAVQDLVFTGNWNGLAATGTNTSVGITFDNDLPANAKLNYIRINNVDVSGFKLGGIYTKGDTAKAGFTDLRITNSAAHDNGDFGIDIEGTFSASSTLYANSNVYIGYCTVYNNGGLPGKPNHSGDGIILGDTDSGTIERCVAYNNGQDNNFANGGPVGIWTWDSNNITIQYNESYANKTGTSSKLDGGGFDLDGGVTNSVLQYNYSHDNYGAGYLLYEFTGARPYGNNTVRYNISQNDARFGHYAGIYLGGGTAVVNNQIYNNTIYLSPGPDSTIAAIKITNGGIGNGNRFRNNVFYTTSSVPVLRGDSAYATTKALFQGNDYFNASGNISFVWGGTTYTSLSAFRTSTTPNQEVNGASNTGTSANPNFVSPGTGGNLNDATKLPTLVAYQLLPTSPLINTGLDLTTFSIAPGSHDFYGGTIPAGGAYDIGAFESSPTATGTTSADTFLLRIGPTGNIELFINTPTTSAPTLAWAPAVYTAYAINGNGGDDTMTLDLSNGNPLPANGASFTGTNSPDHLIINGTPNADNITLGASSVTPATTGPALTYTGVGNISVNTGLGNDTLQLAASGPAASASVNLGTGNDTLSINTGTYTFNSDAANVSPTLAVTVAANSTAIFNTTQHLTALDIFGSATLAAGANKVLVTKSLTLEPNAQLNLNDNAAIVDYTANSPIGAWVTNGTNGHYTGLTNAIVTGRNTGFWNGPGIISTYAMANGSRYTVGIAEASTALSFGAGTTATFAGQTVDQTAVLIRYTLAGDTDLDQKITGDDYFRIDSGFTARSQGFNNGDSDYNGLINADDYWFLDSNYSHPMT